MTTMLYPKIRLLISLLGSLASLSLALETPPAIAFDLIKIEKQENSINLPIKPGEKGEPEGTRSGASRSG